MTLMLLLSGLGLLAVPAWARQLSRRLPPAEWAKLCAALLAAGAIVIEASFVIQAAPTVLRTVGLDGIADLCEHALGAVTPGGAPVGIAAASGAVAMAVFAARAVLTVRRAQRMAWVERELGWHGMLGGHHLVVLPSPKPVAFSNGGWFGQVVITHGLITALSDDQLAAVLCHELAHLRHRHQRYLLLASAVGTILGWLPLVGQGVAALRCALERWADEEAAGPAPAGRANVHAALLRVAELASMPEVAAFTTPGTVAERLEALQAEPTRGRAIGPRTLVYLPAGMLLVAAVVALDSILAHVTFLHMLAGLCPPH
jgi:Peptidase family M48